MRILFTVRTDTIAGENDFAFRHTLFRKAGFDQLHCSFKHRIFLNGDNMMAFVALETSH
ncbi:Uncharacterised protein [Klebsiella variicola]|nr:Uncharacterised protein [Klebsiella variicola]